MTNGALSVPRFDLKSIFNVTSFIYVAKACVPRLGSFQPTLTTVVDGWICVETGLVS
jgi:hypothetical protein